MSMSGVAGGSAPSGWTPIQGNNNNGQQTSDTSQLSPFAALLTQEPSDSISVSLPNGMTIGIVHIGGGSSGFDAQMLHSLEDLVSNLSAYSTTAQIGGQTNGSTTPSDAARVDPTSGESGDDETQETRAFDMIHVDLPNGMSIEIRHNSPHGDADGGAAAVSAMEKAMEELVDHFASLSDPSTDTGSSASNATSQQKLAAYAEQARQKALASLIPDPGVSRES